MKVYKIFRPTAKGLYSLLTSYKYGTIVDHSNVIAPFFAYRRLKDAKRNASHGHVIFRCKASGTSKPPVAIVGWPDVYTLKELEEWWAGEWKETAPSMTPPNGTIMVKHLTLERQVWPTISR